MPVFTSNEDYRRDGAAPADERAERNRILSEARKAKLSVGTVHAYVLTPDGRPLDSLHVAEAAKPARLIEMLERAVATLQVKEGKPVVPPTTVSVRPKCEPGSLVLHLTARALGGGDAWGNFPAEDWIVYGPEEVRKLLPAGAAKVGTSWVLDAGQTAKLLTHFYPATENNDVSKNRLDEQELRATVVSLEKGVARARVEGRLKMQHSFYHKPDGKMVDAEIVGYLDFEPGKPGVKALRLVTEKAMYGRGKFGVAVRAVP